MPRTILGIKENVNNSFPSQWPPVLKRPCSKSLFFMVAQCLSPEFHNNESKKSVYENESLSLPGSQVAKKTGVKSNQVSTVSELDIQKWLDNETGMDRVRQMYAIGNDGSFVQEETQIMNKIWLRTVLTGFFIQVLLRNLNQEKGKKNLSKSSAMQKDYASLIPKAAMKDTLRNTFRLSVWAGSLVYISQTISAYRNKSSLWEYVISSAVGFGSLGLARGPVRLAYLTSFGVAVGFIGGQLICKLMVDSSATQEMRHTRHLKEILQLQDGS